VSAPLTILHLTHEGHGAGSSISIALLARAQAAAGHRVVVGCPPGTWLEGRIRDDGGAAFAPIGFADTALAADEIERLTWVLKIDLVNAHSSKDRSATRRLRFQRRLFPALVMTRRGMPMSTLASGIMSGFAADRTIAVSRPVARALIARGTPPWRISVVNNAVDLARVDRPVGDEERFRVSALIDRPASVQSPQSPQERPVIGVVSRQKDHDTLLKALEFVTTPVTLCAVGFFPDQYLSSLKPPALHRVVWVPFQDDVRAFYDRFDVVALPTRSEGMSQSLLEAMALGKPVVTTARGGNTDLVQDGVNGLLVPPRDPRSLGTAIQRLLADPALRARVGAAARRRVREDFTIQRTLEQTDAVYRAALARRPRKAPGL
jgi:glycosyltransferase involved in cell wall biosynthesis